MVDIIDLLVRLVFVVACVFVCVCVCVCVCVVVMCVFVLWFVFVLVLHGLVSVQTTYVIIITSQTNVLCLGMRAGTLAWSSAFIVSCNGRLPGCISTRSSMHDASSRPGMLSLTVGTPFLTPRAATENLMRKFIRFVHALE